jgi:RNA polymerase sigma factor (TIGR02999 family)
MKTHSQQEITELLLAWSDGDQAALGQLAPLVEDELRRLVGGYLKREAHNHFLQTTEIVNEMYRRMISWQGLRWQSRAHFFGVAAMFIRHILVDAVRAQNFGKRDGRISVTSIDEETAVTTGRSVDLIALDQALTRLAQLDARQSRVVELRFFVGLSYKEIAEVMKISPGAARNDWILAKAWLFRELSGESG